MTTSYIDVWETCFFHRSHVTWLVHCSRATWLVHAWHDSSIFDMTRSPVTWPRSPMTWLCLDDGETWLIHMCVCVCVCARVCLCVCVCQWESTFIFFFLIQDLRCLDSVLMSKRHDSFIYVTEFIYSAMIRISNHLILCWCQASFVMSRTMRSPCHEQNGVIGDHHVTNDALILYWCQKDMTQSLNFVLMFVTWWSSMTRFSHEFGKTWLIHICDRIHS